MTHQANFALPEQGYTHWWKMFNHRQLLVHASLAKSIFNGEVAEEVKHQGLGAMQQFLRNQNMFVFWNPQRDTPEPFFSNNNYATKLRPVENCSLGTLGRGNWTSCIEGVIEGLEWARQPWEVAPPEYREKRRGQGPIDRSGPSRCRYPVLFRIRPDRDRGKFLRLGYHRSSIRRQHILFRPVQFLPRLAQVLTACGLPRHMRADQDPKHPGGSEAEEPARGGGKRALPLAADRLLDRSPPDSKDGGLLAFTFHHSEDSQWAIVLLSLFDAGFISRQTYPIRAMRARVRSARSAPGAPSTTSSTSAGSGLRNPREVSWPKMRQWVKAELRRLRQAAGVVQVPRAVRRRRPRHPAREGPRSSTAATTVRVFTGESQSLSIQRALLGINQVPRRGHRHTRRAASQHRGAAGIPVPPALRRPVLADPRGSREEPSGHGHHPEGI